ncbi:MAG: glycosyltransferase family 9 protein, partial [Prevotellaceae bacterium]|nr:glycosyltransferase family 9 protein [Prevotellaceae bacterium]
MKTDHLLIMRFSAMGDVAMIVPVVKLLSQQYPDLRVTVLSRPFAKPLFDEISPNVSFMGADVSNEYKHITGLNELYKRLTAKHFTAVADFHGVLRTEYLRSRFALSRVKVAHIDKHRSGRKALCRQTDKQLIQQPSPFENYADVLAKLGFPVTLDQSEVPFRFSQSHFVKPEGESWIGIAPTAAFRGKTYPLEKMKEVVSTLIKRYPYCRIYIFGAKKEEYAAIAPNGTDSVVDVSSVVKGLDNELRLMSQLDVMVSMDSANMHFASLVGVPVVSVWGQTHPLAGFMGWGQSEDNAVQTDLPCRPCSIFGNKECKYGDYRCMVSITPESIVEKIQKSVNC